jgi:hypothetical protein
MIKTFSELHDFKSFTLRQNVFDTEAAEALKLLLAKKAPENLSSLRLNSL